MVQSDMAREIWYDLVREYTLRLVKIRSVSPGKGEVDVAQEVVRLLRGGDAEEMYTESGLDPIEGDSYGRVNAYAFLRGSSATTLVLLGHIDTVDTQDYSALEPWAIDPEKLSPRLATHLESDQQTSEWLFGRGIADMKSGVAVNIALMRRLANAARSFPLPISVVMLATPDEENESAGVLHAVRLLLRLREEYGLEYIGAINTDYTTALYPGDPHKYIYAGSIGKLLPSFLCIGRESHVGAPFHGIDANLLAAELIRELSMNPDFCDSVSGQVAAPPVTLHASDLKPHYDVQLPFAAYFYLNVLTLTTTPDALLERLRQSCTDVLERMLRRIDEVEQRWRLSSTEYQGQEPPHPRSGSVFAYADLYAETAQRLGEERVVHELNNEWTRWPSTLDKRELSLHLVHRLWQLSGRRGPAIVIYYSPPYYPHVAPTGGLLQDAIEAVITAHPEERLLLRPYYPYLSDMSYLRLDAGIDLTALQSNMPIWGDRDTETPPGSYYLPFAAIQDLALPVVNWGPYGMGVHQRDERLFLPYSFGTLPQLLYETIEQLILLGQ